MASELAALQEKVRPLRAWRVAEHAPGVWQSTR